ncbi:MAG: phenylalanine--tRNA ligase subunit alpha [Armatimonadetes bacterium]|nr:phenylalanine--tRNA ligase subunit alpha [Armatimonadota bacterium]
MITAHDVEKISAEGERAIRAADDLNALEEVRRTYLGRKGKLPAMFREVPSLPSAERARVGDQLNQVRARLEAALDARAAELAGVTLTKRLASEATDVTLPGRRRILGRLHVLTRTLEEVQRIFHGMGFEIVEGPEIETEEFNFERLNIPRDHPARDAQDSFYISDEILLRTQTTSVDARVMIGRKPPMRILTTGRCYRRDAPDWKRMPVFHQVDGFMVGERITMADLKGVLSSFARQLFGPQTKTKFVPGYFPFTEPSAELYVYFNEEWMELGGCGMFHPRVLEYASIDPQRYTAFAFGLGVDRQVMVRYGIPDIRLFWDNDLRMLEQF